MARFKKVSHQYQDYELNICDKCDLPFNDYNKSGVCNNCLEKPAAAGETLKRLRIKLAWLVLYRAVKTGENSTTARARILAIIGLKTRYKHKPNQFKAA